MNTSVHLSRTSSAKTVRTHYTEDEDEGYTNGHQTDAFLTELDETEDEEDNHVRRYLGESH